MPQDLLPEKKPQAKPFPAARPAPRQVTPAVSVTISLPAFSFDEHAKLKLPLLLIILILFSFSVVMLDKSNLKTMDLFDLNRTEFNFAKVYSVNFVIFLLLFSLTIALATYYGHLLNPWLAALPIPVLLAGSVALGFIFPQLGGPTFALAATAAACALLSSFYEDLSFRKTLSLTGKAMVLLILLSFLIIQGKVSADKQLYEDTFFSSLSGADVNATTKTSNATVLVSKEDFYDLLPNATVKQAMLNLTGMNATNASTHDALAAQLKTALLTDSAYSKLANKTTLPAAQVPTKAAFLAVPGVKMYSGNLPTLAGLAVASATALFSILIIILSSVLVALLLKATS